jgi:CRP-like cAMP-binding protein
MTNEPQPLEMLDMIDSNVLFEHLDREQRERLYRQITFHTYPAGQQFHSPYQAGDHLYLLQRGRVRLYKLSPEGRTLTLAVLEPGTLFGEMMLIGQHIHDSYAEAMTDCTIALLRRDVLHALLQSNPHVAQSFLDLMGQRLRELETKLADIAFKSVPQRLASVLVGLAGLADGAATAASSAPSVVRYTHQQLAEMIGSYRETVTKTIGEFREAGLIRVDDDTIHLTNLEELREMAHK